MKRFLCAILLCVFLSGCSSGSGDIDGAMTLRSKLMKSQGCQFSAQIHADYGDAVYSFTLDCSFDPAGNMEFTVSEPESIKGITGSVSASGGAITFDEEILTFPVLADDQITPVSAPYVMLKALRSGYIQATGTWEKGYHIQLNDSYLEDPLQVDLYTDSAYIPVAAEILWRGKRILSIHVEKFAFL